MVIDWQLNGRKHAIPQRGFDVLRRKKSLRWTKKLKKLHMRTSVVLKEKLKDEQNERKKNSRRTEWVRYGTE